MKTIGILSALGREIKEIKNNIDIVECLEIKGYRFSIGYYYNLKIIIGTTSVGKVNAAVCSEILINNFKPSAIINTGIAGGLNGMIKVLDVVISDNIAYHDIANYILKGCYPYMESFPTDSSLLDKTRNLINLNANNSKIHIGKIISGDVFVSNHADKEKLINLYNPLCVEMEGAAIAHVCYINKIPYISFRGISDSADNSARETYDQNEILAANEAGKLVLKFLKELT